jgi:hypothetical protein
MKKMYFRTLGPLVLLGFILASVQIVGSDEGEPIPDTLYRSSGQLQFVALDRAVDAGGNIDTHLVGESYARSLAEKLALPEGKNGCVEYYGFSSVDVHNGRFVDLESSLRLADHYLIGRVLGLRIGYYGHRFGNLALIEPEEGLAGSPSAQYYVFYPKGEFRFQGKKYCITNDYYPDVPAVGDRILIMHGNRISTSALVGISPASLVLLPSEKPPSVGLKAIGRSGLSFESAEDVITWAKDSLTEAGKL